MILTRLPMGRIDGALPPLAHSVWAFPLIGAVLGLGMGLAYLAALGLGLPSLVGAFLALGLGILATGGLHEDGLADMADGFGGGHTVQRKLEIMRDSRIGSYGVLALILVIGLTATAIEAAGGLTAFIAIGAASRTAMLLPMALLPPARNDGLGHSAKLGWSRATSAAFVLTLAIAVATQSILATLAILATALAFTLVAQRQIGGQTGDVLGATQKLSECAGWLIVAALS